MRQSAEKHEQDTDPHKYPSQSLAAQALLLIARPRIRTWTVAAGRNNATEAAVVECAHDSTDIASSDRLGGYSMDCANSDGVRLQVRRGAATRAPITVPAQASVTQRLPLRRAQIFRVLSPPLSRGHGGTRLATASASTKCMVPSEAKTMMSCGLSLGKSTSLVASMASSSPSQCSSGKAGTACGRPPP
jgi:hypothetical protein